MLTLAAASGREERVERLLHLGHSPCDADEAACLHSACHARAADCVGLLLGAHADPERRLAGGATPLLAACACGAVACARLLLAKEASPNAAAEDGATPLYTSSLLAPIDETAALVRSLLAAHADANVPTRSGAVPLHAACLRGDVATAELLLESTHSDATDNRGATPMLVACAHGRPQCVALLLRAGASPHVPSHAGVTPLRAAHFTRQSECVALLLGSLDAPASRAATPISASPTPSPLSNLSAAAKEFVPTHRPASPPAASASRKQRRAADADYRDFFSLVGWAPSSASASNDDDAEEHGAETPGVFDGWSPAVSSGEEDGDDGDELIRRLVSSPDRRPSAQWWAVWRRKQDRREGGSSPVPSYHEAVAADGAGHGLLGEGDEDAPGGSVEPLRAFLTRIGWMDGLHDDYDDLPTLHHAEESPAPAQCVTPRMQADDEPCASSARPPLGSLGGPNYSDAGPQAAAAAPTALVPLQMPAPSTTTPAMAASPVGLLQQAAARASAEVSAATIVQMAWRRRRVRLAAAWHGRLRSISRANAPSAAVSDVAAAPSATFAATFAAPSATFAAPSATFAATSATFAAPSATFAATSATFAAPSPAPQQSLSKPAPPREAPPPAPLGTRRVTLIKSEASTRLGLVLSGGDDGPPMISGLRDGCVAAASGGLTVGETLVSVNGVALTGHQHGTQLLRACVGTLELELEAISVHVEAAQALEAAARAQVDSFRCPVTLEVMVDPVRTCDGMVYERAAIRAWLATHTTSPLTGAPLVSNMLVADGELKKRIDAFFAKHPHLRSPPTIDAARSGMWEHAMAAVSVCHGDVDPPPPAMVGKGAAADPRAQARAGSSSDMGATPRTGGSRGGRRRGRVPWGS